MALSLTSPPATEPIALADAKAHLQIDHAAEDDYLEDFLIPAARRYAETLTHRSFITQTWVLRLNGFGGGPIYLPRPPLVSITSVAYTDTAGRRGRLTPTGTRWRRPRGSTRSMRRFGRPTA